MYISPEQTVPGTPSPFSGDKTAEAWIREEAVGTVHANQSGEDSRAFQPSR